MGVSAEARYLAKCKRRDDAHFASLWLGGMNAPADVLAAQERVLQTLEAAAADAAAEIDLHPVRVVVERYGRVWAKDTDYYAAAAALGIKEPPA